MSYSWGASRNPVHTESFPAVGPVLGAGATVPGGIPAAAPAGPVRSAAATPGWEQQRVAAELAPMVDVWRRLLVQHVPDRGGRCRTCTKGGTGVPSTPWPCAIHGIADLARRRHDAQLR